MDTPAVNPTRRELIALGYLTAALSERKTPVGQMTQGEILNLWQEGITAAAECLSPDDLAVEVEMERFDV